MPRKAPDRTLAALFDRAERRLKRSEKVHRRQRSAAVRNVLLPEYATDLPTARLLRVEYRDAVGPLPCGTTLTPEVAPYVSWRTTAEIAPWPVAIAGARVIAAEDGLPADFGARLALRIELTVSDDDADAPEAERSLTLYLAGPDSLAWELAEAIGPRLRAAAARPRGSSGAWTRVTVQSAGAGPGRELWPSPPSLPPGSRRVTEHLLFPELARLFAVEGLQAVGAGASFELLLPLDRAPGKGDGLGRGSIVPNVVPAINLIERAVTLLEPPGPRRGVPVLLQPGEEPLDVTAVQLHDAKAGRSPIPWPRFAPGGRERWRTWHPPLPRGARSRLLFAVHPKVHLPRGALTLRVSAHNGAAAAAETAGRRLVSDDFTAAAELLAAGCGPLMTPPVLPVSWLAAARAEPATEAVLRRRLKVAALVGWRAVAGDRLTAGRLRQAAAAVPGVRFVSAELDTAPSDVPGALFRGRHLTVEVEPARLPGGAVAAFVAALDQALADAAPLGLFHRLTAIVQPDGEVYRCQPHFGAGVPL